MEFPKILLDKISYNLREKKESISMAESVTSGFLQLAFSQMPSAEQFFKGGITAYTIEEKVKHLNIDFDEALATNCVKSLDGLFKEFPERSDSFLFSDSIDQTTDGESHRSACRDNN